MQDEDAGSAIDEARLKLSWRADPANQRWDRRRLVAALLAVVAIAGLGALLPGQLHDFKYARDNSETALRAQGTRAAQRAVLSLTSPSATDADKYVAGLLAVATGDFKDQLAQIAQKLAQTVKAAGVTAESSISSVGVSSVDTKSRTVIVVVTVTQKLKNKDTPNGEPRYYRMRVSTVKQGDKWLISDARFVA